MADPRPPQEEVPLRDEYRALPGERDSRRTHWLRRTLLLSLIGHVLFVIVVALLVRFLPAPEPPPPPPRVIPLLPPSVIAGMKPKIPEPTPPDTNVVSSRNSAARSPGEGPPTPHGETSTPDPDSAARAPEPRAEQRPRPRPPPDQPPTQVPTLAPQEPPPAEGEPSDDPQERLAKALRGIGGGDNWGDMPGTGSSGLGFNWGGGEMQIESRSDVDFGPWAEATLQKVKRNWLSIIPVAARVGMKGIVLVRFRVQRDGSITDFETLESSGLPPLDKAAEDALVRMSVPLPPLPLPADSEENDIRVTYMFIYNLDDDREIRLWKRQHWKPRPQAGG